MSKKFRLPGLPPIPVVSDEAAEKADFVVCVPWGTPSPFSDNLKGICSHCGIDVQYRWHAPRKPKRLCMDCFVKLESKIAVESQETKHERGGN
jgi:hypothetical protein